MPNVHEKSYRDAQERTELAYERTVLAWQRNRLSELSVLLGAAGIGLVTMKFYPEYWLAGITVMFFSLAGFAYTLYRYFGIKREWRKKRG